MTLDVEVLTDEDFPAVLTAIFAQKYTGSVIIHFKNGCPAVIEIPSHQIRLGGTPLDKPRRLAETR